MLRVHVEEDRRGKKERKLQLDKVGGRCRSCGGGWKGKGKMNSS
jgi:hypothetical protein